MCPTYEYYCGECKTVTPEQFEYSKRPTEVPCKYCQKSAGYMLSAPALMQAALPDGTRRKGWDVLREASKLELEAANSKTDTKREIKKEIRKMGVKPSKTI